MLVAICQGFPNKAINSIEMAQEAGLGSFKKGFKQKEMMKKKARSLAISAMCSDNLMNQY